MLDESVQFVTQMWSRAGSKTGDRVFMSVKSSSGFRDVPMRYGPDVGAAVQRLLERHDREGNHVYFCPTPFRPDAKQRRKGEVARVGVLWADVDAAPVPRSPRPSVVVESSPGRTQAFWYLRRPIRDLDAAEALNRDITYAIDADHGGWDLTQVLRVPGTRNWKYPSGPRVRVLSDSGRSVDPADLRSSVPRSEAAERGPTAQHAGATAQPGREALIRARRRLPAATRALLRRKPEVGKRSEVLWRLECDMAEAGLDRDEIVALVRESPWNKFRGRRDELKRLTAEVDKALHGLRPVRKERAASEDEEEDEPEGLRVETFTDVMATRDAYPGWLVEGFWLQRSHGAIAGEPKSFKSTLATDLAVAVASGRPFLGRYPVLHQGPVVYVQNENARWIVRDRLGKIAAHRGVVGSVRTVGRNLRVRFAPDIPLHLVNQQGFLLTDPGHQRALEQLISEVKPSLVILDPLYLMFDGDVNSSRDLNPTLSWLLELRVKHDTGVILVHHWNKRTETSSQRGGQRMLGSTTIHGWVESAWYVQVDDATELDDADAEDVTAPRASSSVVIEREFRGAGTHPRVDLELAMGPVGTFEYDVTAEIHRPKKKRTKAPSDDELKQEVVELLRTKSGGTSEKDLARSVGVDRSRVSACVDRLITARLALRRDGLVFKV